MEETEFRNIVRKYLLGDLPEAEMQRFEEHCFSDADAQESVLIAEDELIDDYLDGLLDESEVKKFKTYFLATPKQIQWLRIAQSVKKHAGTSHWVIPPDPDGVPAQDDAQPARSRPWFDFTRPLTLVPLFVAFLIVIALGAVGLNQWRRIRERRAEQSRYAELEQELAQVNQSATEVVSPVVLPPVTTRSGGVSSKVALPEGSGPVELRMIVVGEKDPKYQASLQLPGISRPLVIKNLSPPGPTGQVAL